MKLSERLKYTFILFFIIPQIILSVVLFSFLNKEVLKKVQSKYLFEVSNIRDNNIELFTEISESIITSSVEDYYLDYNLNKLTSDMSKYKILPWRPIVYFINRDGRNISPYINNKPLKVLNPNINIENKSIIWETNTLSNISGKMVITAKKNIYDLDNSFLGQFIIETPINYFLEKFKINALEKGIRLILINNFNKAITLNRNEFEPIEYLNNFIWLEIINNEKIEKIKLIDKFYYPLVVELKIFDMHLISLIPYKEIRGEILPILSITLLLLISFTILYLILITKISNKIINIIFNINNHLNSIKHGEYSNRGTVSSIDDVNSITSAINGLSDSLLKKINMRKKLLNVISLNSASPVTLLINTTQMLSLENPEETMYKDMFSASEKIKNLVYNTLTFLKLDEGMIKNFKEIDIYDITEQLSHLYKNRYKDVPIVIRSSENDSFVISGDDHIFKTIIENLIDNSLKYSNSGDSILIDIESSETDIIWRISDKGKGFPKMGKSVLLDTFTSLDSKNSAFLGQTGIGLFIVNELTHHLNGTIDIIESKHGAIIELSFPSFKFLS